ncbi:MAG: glutamine-hydrolyzing GMP synthase [Candidatus Tectomicrobia bacterium]|uniref:GMP synthase [glutamine-hydrolyzing] n=1 Tax=Tectimicrobiota bacterium TaxID=2528274 RepID=A0A932GQH8_UNCTE|nr:glutamine-hydrolyzing GMP synthase [Candidatus Tectomicrobia bacterium]
MDIRGDKILILDFGSQYTQLIARRIRELKVFSEIVPFSMPASEIRRQAPKGLVLSGGPASVYAADAPICNPEIFSLGIPVLGICYGMQVMAHLLEGKVSSSARREYGPARLLIDREVDLLSGLEDNGAPNGTPVWMSHGDRIEKLPAGFVPLAHTDNSPVAVMGSPARRLYGVQFHPEVVHTPKGGVLFANFLFRACSCTPSWSMASFAAEAVGEIRRRVGSARVLCALSGGVDSSVTAVLVHRAIGEQLTCVFVDNGLLRSGEAEEVEATFRRHFHMNLRVVDAGQRFLSRLAGVEDPEQKRKIVGEEFIAVFEEEAGRLGEIQFLAQGTLYPDVIESRSVRGPSATIKSHHNVGGLPERLHFQLIEPLKDLFKDEVRRLGKELGIHGSILWRQPFPGPGLSIRVLGPVSRETLDLVRQADRILLEEVEAAGLLERLWQSFAVLLPVRSVGVMGDERTYEQVACLRVVESQDGMTADWARLPYDLLSRVSNRIINEVRGINRVVYDISSKPPSTIEWE